MAGRSARVIIASTRASAGVYQDRCGPIITEWLAQHGFSPAQLVLVGDGEPVGKSLRDAVTEGVDLVITSGGTGISPSDDTPAQTKAVLDYEIPGLADAIRRSGLPKVPTAVLSRGTCGVAGRTLVVNLPGSPKGALECLAAIMDLLPHAIAVLAGEQRH